MVQLSGHTRDRALALEPKETEWGSEEREIRASEPGIQKFLDLWDKFGKED